MTNVNVRPNVLLQTLSDVNLVDLSNPSNKLMTTILITLITDHSALTQSI